MDYLTSKIEFFNRETGEKISGFTEVEHMFYSQSNRVFFIQNEDDDFYSPEKNKIDFGLDFIVVSRTKLDISDVYFSNCFCQNFGNEKIFVYELKFSKDICVKLNIETAQKTPLNLVGGLKKSRNCYYKFGLPVIEFSQPQKFMYINSNFVEINSNRVVLSKLPCLESVIKKGGSIAIRLADYLPVNFTVEGIDSEIDKADEFGWEFNEFRYIPSVISMDEEVKKGTIIGFNSNIEFKPTKKELVKDNRRSFIIHNEYLENRFSKRKVF